MSFRPCHHLCDCRCFPLYCKDKVALKTVKRRGHNPQGLQRRCVHAACPRCVLFLLHRWDNICILLKVTSLTEFSGIDSVVVYLSSVCFRGFFFLTNISLFFLIMNVWEDACDRYSIVQKLKFINNWNVVEYEVMNTNYSFHVWQVPVDQYISPDFNLVLVMVSSIAH